MLTPIVISLAAIFTPPKDFEKLESKPCSYLQKGKEGFVPSIHYATTKTSRSLIEYVAGMRKEYNRDRTVHFYELGSISTELGPAEVCRIDGKCEWGDYSSFQAVVIKEGQVHLLTACCLSSDAKKFTPEFFQAFKSLKP
ncbi:MAG: hypothetical protein MRY21_01855 [Simkaniaceae bacterium]|nr:hypothetical protein [Simkaniaceae bacterium]